MPYRKRAVNTDYRERSRPKRARGEYNEEAGGYVIKTYNVYDTRGDWVDKMTLTKAKAMCKKRRGFVLQDPRTKNWWSVEFGWTSRQP